MEILCILCVLIFLLGLVVVFEVVFVVCIGLGRFVFLKKFLK